MLIPIVAFLVVIANEMSNYFQQTPTVSLKACEYGPQRLLSFDPNSQPMNVQQFQTAWRKISSNPYYRIAVIGGAKVGKTHP